MPAFGTCMLYLIIFIYFLNYRLGRSSIGGELIMTDNAESITAVERPMLILHHVITILSYSSVNGGLISSSKSAKHNLVETCYITNSLRVPVVFVGGRGIPPRVVSNGCPNGCPNGCFHWLPICPPLFSASKTLNPLPIEPAEFLRVLWRVVCD